MAWPDVLSLMISNNRVHLFILLFFDVYSQMCIYNTNTKVNLIIITIKANVEVHSVNLFT